MCFHREWACVQRELQVLFHWDLYRIWIDFRHKPWLSLPPAWCCSCLKNQFESNDRSDFTLLRLIPSVWLPNASLHIYTPAFLLVGIYQSCISSENLLSQWGVTTPYWVKQMGWVGFLLNWRKNPIRRKKPTKSWTCSYTVILCVLHKFSWNPNWWAWMRRNPIYLQKSSPVWFGLLKLTKIYLGLQHNSG